MGKRSLRVSLVPLLVVTLLSMSLVGVATAAGGSGENGDQPPPSGSGTSNLVVGVVAVVAAVGLILWFTRSKGEPEEKTETRAEAAEEKAGHPSMEKICGKSPE